MKYTRAFKVFRVRRDGSLGPLFVDARARIPRDAWVVARTDLAPPTWIADSKRPGWHAKVDLIDALDLARAKPDRAVFLVMLRGNVQQLGKLLLASEMKVVKRVKR